MSNGALVPTLKVLANGSELPPEAAHDLISGSVLLDVDAPGMFALRLINWDMNQLKVTWADSTLFAAGNEIEIHMGYVDRLEKIFVGEITAIEPEYDADAVPTVTVRGYDRAHRLLRGRHTRSFVGMKDSEIAVKVASEAGLAGEAEDTGLKLDYVLQHSQTDLDFLNDRAWRYGYEVLVEDKTLHFRPHKNAESAAITLTWGVDLISFHPRLKTAAQAGSVEVRGWSPKDKKEIVGKAEAGAEQSKMGGSATAATVADKAFGDALATSVTRPVFSQEEADQVAQGRFREMGLNYIGGEGLCEGMTELRAGTVIEIAGVGESFSGPYYVSSATHEYTPRRGYRTSFTVNRNAT